jgi:hypothetical protein
MGHDPGHPDRRPSSADGSARPGPESGPEFIRSSSPTAAPRACGRSTPARPMSWPSHRARTSSSPIWSCRRTAPSSSGTKTRSAARPTSPTHAGFADRKATRVIDGVPTTGWFTEDFTLAELRTLRARERLPAFRPDNTAFDGRDGILTFDEVVEIARAGSARTGRTISVAPELKHPVVFRRDRPADGGRLRRHAGAAGPDRRRRPDPDPVFRGRASGAAVRPASARPCCS